MKLRELLREGEKALLEAGVPGATHDARALLYDTFGMDGASYLLHAEDEAAPDAAAAFRVYCGRRARREPLQYITGRAEFMGLSFLCRPPVLIPRFDSETLVSWAAESARPGMRVLDLCTGSGCLLLSLLHEAPGMTGYGSDISEEAVLLARENAANLGIAAAFFRADLFTPADAEGYAIMEHGFDILTCNPPYIAAEEIPLMDPEVLGYEDHGALFGGPDGLAFYRRVIPEAGAHLAAGGELFLEIGSGQAPQVMRMMEEHGFRNVSCRKDLAGRDRVIRGKKDV